MNVLDSRHMRQKSLIDRCKHLPLQIDRFDQYFSALKRRNEISQQLSVLNDRLKVSDAKAKICEDLLGWFSGGLKLERATNSAIHRFQEALNSRNVYSLDDNDPVAEPFDILSLHSFVVEHDLAGAFAKMENFESGDFELPYDATMFEFQLSGKRVMLVAARDKDVIWTLIYVETSGHWFCPSFTYHFGTDLGQHDTGDAGIFKAIYDRLNPQIRAICIALDAKIATEEIVRAPIALNKSRVKAGKPPLVDYSIVKLMHRSKYEPLENACAEDGPKRRLHFVRGHWRHFETHKTWIKWFLRGDPDLGFIEKEYRL